VLGSGLICGSRRSFVRGKLKRPSPALVVACIALFVALGPAAYAANTIFSTDIVDGEVKTVDLGDEAVTNPKLALNSVGTGRVIDNSLTSADLKGADVKGGKVSFSLGAVANGRCADFSVATAGAKTGEGVVFSLQAAAPQGMLFYGVRVPVDNQVTLKLCNLTGGISPAISNLPVRVMTFG
jgi:hypothetical protein